MPEKCRGIAQGVHGPQNGGDLGLDAEGEVVQHEVCELGHVHQAVLNVQSLYLDAGVADASRGSQQLLRGHKFEERGMAQRCGCA